MKTIVFSPAASKEFDALPLKAQDAIEAALHEYAFTGRGHVQPLAGEPGYRMRVGSYRVIFAEDQTTILAFQIGRRSTTTYRRN